MKKFIAATTVVATLLTFPIAAFAKSYSIAELKAMAQESGYTVQETSGQLVITKPVTSATPKPSTPTTPAPQPPVTNPPSEDVANDFRFSPKIELSTTKNITTSTLVLHVAYNKQISGRNTFNVTKEAKFEVAKDAPFTLDDQYRIIPTKTGTGIITITYKGKQAEMIVEIRAFKKTKDGVSCYAVGKGFTSDNKNKR